MVDLQRKITHSGYKENDNKKKYYKGLSKAISTKPRGIKQEWINSKNSNYLVFTNDFVQIKTGANAIPFVGGGICLFMLLLFSYVWYFNGTLGITGICFFVASILLLIFFIAYYLTMPKKEHILNRLDGLITFTGTFWQKNITMTFDEVEFNYTTGNEDGTGAFMLQVVRPNKVRSFDIFSFGGTNCYEDLTMITWYMDKNRPLPPGDAFDPYREQDFLRRRAEGFPPPLYKSYISTPEATLEQQAEREQYWTDEQYTEKFEREEGSEWYDPQIHTDWEETSFYEPNTKIPVENTYVKFIFNDGRIIYSQTNEDGSLFEPPESENFEMQFVNIKQ